MKYVSEKAKELIETRKEDCEEAIIDALADLQARQDQMRAAFETYHALRSLNLDYPVTDKYKVRADYSSISAMGAHLTYCPYDEFPIKMQLNNGYAKLKAKSGSLIIEVIPEYAYTLSEEINTARVDTEIYGRYQEIVHFIDHLCEFAQAISDKAE
jgi:hypothetical protein